MKRALINVLDKLYSWYTMSVAVNLRRIISNLDCVIRKITCVSKRLFLQT